MFRLRSVLRRTPRMIHSQWTLDCFKHACPRHGPAYFSCDGPWRSLHAADEHSLHETTVWQKFQLNKSCTSYGKRSGESSGNHVQSFIFREYIMLQWKLQKSLITGARLQISRIPKVANPRLWKLDTADALALRKHSEYSVLVTTFKLYQNIGLCILQCCLPSVGTIPIDLNL